ncbi:MAG TPA: hypothetical protein VM686_04065 [Polyangiaceae bacterium]|jgi:hypothetical protein|nr:hypothetical protein [Polyangiaceae bacterium]
MRTALLISALMLGCSGGQERPAEEPEAPSESEETEGFSPEQKEALSELLGEDVSEEQGGEQPAQASPAGSSAPPSP